MIMTFDIGGTSIKYGLMILKDKHPEFLMQKEISSDARIVKGPGIAGCDLTADTCSDSYRGIAISTAGMVDTEDIQYGMIIFQSIPDCSLRMYWRSGFIFPAGWKTM
ncbi:MAG: hypothetical protein ACLUQK_16785 [Clostridium sp.]